MRHHLPIPPPFAFLAAALLLLGCPSPSSDPLEPVTVFATASLDDVVREAAVALEADRGLVLDIHTAGTHQLARELMDAAPADVFVAAGLDHMDELEAKGLIVASSRWEAVGNRMVVLGRRTAGYPSVRLQEAATLRFDRFVVPDPKSDPAGRWAERWLSDVGGRGRSVWDQLGDRLDPVANIHAATRAIAEDASTVGVVFATDIDDVPDSEVLFRSPDLAIRYSFALVDREARSSAAHLLLDFLQSPSGHEILTRNGFEVDAARSSDTGS